MTPEAVDAFGLNSMSTRARNTLQHGELWTRAAFQEFMEDSGESEGMTTRSAPQMVTTPGRTVWMRIGEYQIMTTPNLPSEGPGVEVELRIEEPNAPPAAGVPQEDDI